MSDFALIRNTAGTELPTLIAEAGKHASLRFLVGEVALGCAEKAGTVLYLFSDFTAYQLTA